MFSNICKRYNMKCILLPLLLLGSSKAFVSARQRSNQLREEDQEFGRVVLQHLQQSMPPTTSPSLAQTTEPTFPTAQATVEVRFTLYFVMQGLTVFQVPVDDEQDAFLESIAKPMASIYDELAQETFLTIRSVGGLVVGQQRRLQTEDAVEIATHMRAIRPCFQEDCGHVFAEQMAQETEAVFKKAVLSGDLTRMIRLKAVQLEVLVLQEATVLPTTCRVENVAFQSNPSNTNDQKDGFSITQTPRGTSRANRCAGPLPIVVFILCALL